MYFSAMDNQRWDKYQCSSSLVGQRRHYPSKARTKSSSKMCDAERGIEGFDICTVKLEVLNQLSLFNIEKTPLGHIIMTHFSKIKFFQVLISFINDTV